MAEVINLRQERKAKSRKEKDQKASENRIKFGRTKAEKKIESLKAEQADKQLDGHKLRSTEEEK